MKESITDTINRLAHGVTPIAHEAGRFEVQSKSRAGWKYTVDIFEFGVNSSCTCPKFNDFGIRGKLERGQTTYGVQTECEHIRRVNRYLAIVAKHNLKMLFDRGERTFVEMIIAPLAEQEIEPAF